MSILKAAHRIAFGDTAGTAATAAGRTFQESFETVFSSKETADAFGIDQGILKEAFGKSGDEFSTYLEGQGVKKESIEGLDAFRSEVNKIRSEGSQLSESGMQAMLRNQGELDNMYGGVSRAGATASPNSLLRGMAGEGSGMESVAGIAAVAGLAGAANVVMGGEFSEGAAVGGIGAMSIRGIAKGVASSMGDIEQSMIKSILGEDMVTAGTREVNDTIIEKVTKGTKLSELSATAQRELTMEDINPNFAQAGGAKMSVEDYVNQMGGNTRMRTKQDAEYIYEGTRTETVTGAQARRENLEAIQSLGDDAEQLQGFGKKKMRDMLNPKKEKNVAANNRALVLGGGMLSGIAFTGTADRRDYRRGFNAHRGNRI